MSIKSSYTVTEALVIVKKYCAYQERCHRDVTSKLTSMHMVEEAQLYIINELINDNYLNEERFARSFARGKFRIKHWGKNRIVRELKQRDISVYNINTALQEISEQDYLETLHTLAEKRLAQITETNPFKRKKKLCDYLLYRGWESHLVYDKAKALIPN